MASLIASNPTTPGGTYVVQGPMRTDAIGDILRASFTTKNDAAEEMRCLLAQLDRPTRTS